MSPDKSFPSSTPPGRRDPAGSLPALEALARALDEVSDTAPDSSPSADSQLEMELDTWLHQSIHRDALRSVALSKGALDLVAAFAPDASLSEEFVVRLEARRKAARREIEATQRAAESCKADSPGALLQALRARAGVDSESAATALGLTPRTLSAIETKQEPWYHIQPSALPRFAALVREPVSNLVLLIRLTARRLLMFEVKQRAFALGRFDETQEVSDAQRSRLKLVFARLQQHNRAAAAFLNEAERLTKGGLGNRGEWLEPDRANDK